MAWVMSVLGALLALGGAASLWNGSGYIRMDWGQAETIAGTVALSAGVVAIGLAAVLFRLREMTRAFPRIAPPARPEALMGPDDPAAVALASTGPAPGRLAGSSAAAGLPKPERVEPLTIMSAPASDEDEVLLDARVARDPAPPMPAAMRDDPGLRVVPEAPRPAPPLVEAPTLVGRYEANGATYVLFSDGTIEVETEDGTHRFESMAHLKDHIERQNAG